MNQKYTKDKPMFNFKSYEQRKAEEAAREEAKLLAEAEARLAEMKKHTITICVKQSSKSGGQLAIIKNRNTLRTVGTIKSFQGITDMDGFNIQFTDAFRGVFAGLFATESFFQQAARVIKSAKIPAGYEIELEVAVDPVMMTQLVANAALGYEGNEAGEDMRFAFTGLQVLSAKRGVIMSSTNQADASYQSLTAEERQAALEAMAAKNKEISTVRNRKTLADYRAKTLQSSEAGANTMLTIDV